MFVGLLIGLEGRALLAEGGDEGGQEVGALRGHSLDGSDVCLVCFGRCRIEERLGCQFPTLTGVSSRLVRRRWIMSHTTLTGRSEERFSLGGGRLPTVLSTESLKVGRSAAQLRKTSHGESAISHCVWGAEQRRSHARTWYRALRWIARRCNRSGLLRGKDGRGRHGTRASRD